MDNSLQTACANFPQNGSLCLINTCSVCTVQQNDTCDGISSANNISTTQLLAWNPTDIASGSNTDCGRWYNVYPGDYCNLVVIKFGISLSDFLFLNPELNANCTNLYANESYCVLPVGNIADYPGNPGYVPTATSTGPLVVYSSLPNATYVPPVSNTTTTASLPLASGTRPDCSFYIDGGSNYTCDVVSAVYEVSIDDLTYWNPSLSNLTSCVLSQGVQYCAQLWDELPATSAVISAFIPTATQASLHSQSV